MLAAMRSLAVLAPGIAALLATLALAPAHADGIMAGAKNGDLTLHYDASRWLVSGDDTHRAIWRLDTDRRGPTAEITADTAPDAACFRSGTEHGGWRLGGDEAASSEPISGLDLVISTPDLGCRNRAGGPVYACTRHGGRLYRFIAGEHHGCRLPYGFADTALRLLRGLTAE